MVKNPFKIEIAQNFAMGSFDLVLQIGGLRDQKEAKELADRIAEYMAEDGGWAKRAQ